MRREGEVAEGRDARRCYDFIVLKVMFDKSLENGTGATAGYAKDAQTHLSSFLFAFKRFEWAGE